MQDNSQELVEFPTKRLDPVVGKFIDKIDDRFCREFPTKRLDPVVGKVS